MRGIKSKLIDKSVMIFAASLMVIVPVSTSYAQDDGLADFSLDLDSLPPQPGQVDAPSPVQDQPTSVPQEVAQPSQDVLTPMASDKPAPFDDDFSTPVEHSGLYYDSDSFGPSDELVGKSKAPREVDPKYEPGSRFVVVRQNAPAGSSQAKIVAAQRALNLGRYTSALEIYEQLYKKMPKNKQVLMGLAVAQQNSGYKDSAIATYEELLKLDPKNTEASVNMMGLLKTEYPSVAYRKLRDLWEKEGKNPGVAAQLGLLSAEIGNVDDAIKYLGIASSLDPNNASHYYNMAVITDRAGAYKDALDLYEKALEVDVSYGGSRSIPRDQIYDRLAKLRRL